MDPISRQSAPQETKKVGDLEGHFVVISHPKERTTEEKTQVVFGMRVVPIPQPPQKPRREQKVADSDLLITGEMTLQALEDPFLSRDPLVVKQAVATLEQLEKTKTTASNWFGKMIHKMRSKKASQKDKIAENKGKIRSLLERKYKELKGEIEAKYQRYAVHGKAIPPQIQEAFREELERDLELFLSFPVQWREADSQIGQLLERVKEKSGVIKTVKLTTSQAFLIDKYEDFMTAMFADHTLLAAFQEDDFLQPGDSKKVNAAMEIYERQGVDRLLRHCKANGFSGKDMLLLMKKLYPGDLGGGAHAQHSKLPMFTLNLVMIALQGRSNAHKLITIQRAFPGALPVIQELMVEIDRFKEMAEKMPFYEALPETSYESLAYLLIFSAAPDSEGEIDHKTRVMVKEFMNVQHSRFGPNAFSLLRAIRAQVV